LSKTKSSSEKIILQKLDGDMYAIKSVTHANMYLRFGGSGVSKVVNTQTYPGPWGRFYIEKLDNGKVAFKNVQFGNYLRARDNSDLDTQTYIGSSEQFDIIESSDDSPWHPICNKMEGVVEVPPDKNKCPSGKEVAKEDCIAAGLTVGGKQIGGLSFEGSWNDRPSGCYTEEIGSILIPISKYRQ
jgi:hypothetical protein